MDIRADKEGIETVQALCDIALKTGGLQNFAKINVVLKSLKPLPVQEAKVETPAEELTCSA